MGSGLWSASAEELLERTASADPTPGGGSVAAVTGAFGVALLQMALAVTDEPSLSEQAGRLVALRGRVVPAADADVAVFTTLMAAYRLPRGDETERTARSAAIRQATLAAAEEPLSLAETLLEAVRLSHALEPVVKPGIVSDVLAGRDLAAGAARAALRTAEINLTALERAAAPEAPALRRRRDAVSTALGGTPTDGPVA